MLHEIQDRRPDQGKCTEHGSSTARVAAAALSKCAASVRPADVAPLAEVATGAAVNWTLLLAVYGAAMATASVAWPFVSWRLTERRARIEVGSGISNDGRLIAGPARRMIISTAREPEGGTAVLVIVV